MRIFCDGRKLIDSSRLAAVDPSGSIATASVRGLMALTRPATIASDSPFCESRACMKKVEDAVSATDAMQIDARPNRERLVLQQGYELLRAVIQAHFDLRAAVEVEGADGIERTHVRARASMRALETLLGEVTVPRSETFLELASTPWIESGTAARPLQGYRE